VPLPDLARLPPSVLATQPTVALLLAQTRAHTSAFQLNPSNAADIAAIWGIFIAPKDALYEIRSRRARMRPAAPTLSLQARGS
jgi:hypothetical protein